MTDIEQFANFPFNLLDICVILVLLFSAVLAYLRGFVQEVFSIIGWITAIAVTIYGFPYLQTSVRQIISMDILADLASGLLLFISSLVTISLLTRSISNRVKDSLLNPLDRALGFLFGLARGGLIIVIAYIGIEFLIPDNKKLPWVDNAKTVTLIDPAANFLISILPKDYSIRRRKSPSSSNKVLRPKGANDIFNDLIKPEPSVKKKKSTDGYGNVDRQNMERLIDSTQQNKFD